MRRTKGGGILPRRGRIGCAAEIDKRQDPVQGVGSTVVRVEPTEQVVESDPLQNSPEISHDSGLPSGPFVIATIIVHDLGAKPSDPVSVG